MQKQIRLNAFNSRTAAPECIQDFGDLVIPELQSRGVYKTGYDEGTLRAKLFSSAAGGAGAKLPAIHRAENFVSGVM